MFRKSMMALAAIATLTAAAFAASPVYAKKGGGHHHGHGHGHGWRGGFGITIGAPMVTSCLQYQWVETRRGWRRVLVDLCG